MKSNETPVVAFFFVNEGRERVKIGNSQFFALIAHSFLKAVQ